MALHRYHMTRGKRLAADPLPAGIRQDTRKHTRHVLRPSGEIVERYLADPTESSWRRFAADYRRLLARRFQRDRGPFDELASLAQETDVHLGCSCPTKGNPDLY